MTSTVGEDDQRGGTRSAIVEVGDVDKLSGETRVVDKDEANGDVHLSKRGRGVSTDRRERGIGEVLRDGGTSSAGDCR